ncbi:MAG: chalcone isomerase family protein [Hydrogenophilales bacterium]|nr:chalcone isomerase family protein [Hydrogenophilales bacterium]
MLGTIPGEHFNRALLKIWLGEAPTQISLKRALLGLERPS